MSEERASKGPKKHDPLCYQVQRDIIIPAGTILRRAAEKRGGQGYVECSIGHGKNFASNFVVQVHPDAVASGYFRKVTAS